jgi:hypothetical protein
VNDRNLAVCTGDIKELGTLQKAQCCLECVSLIFGVLLVIPWVFADLLVSVFSFGSAEFLIGGIYFRCPHAWAALLNYLVAVLIFGRLISEEK